MLNFDNYEVLSFDCYGTLIDWETGILAALKPLFSKNNIIISGDRILELYAQFEPEIQNGDFFNYKYVLNKLMERFSAELGFALKKNQSKTLVNSLQNWPTFPDTVAVLKKLKQKYKLAIISNIDDDLFQQSNYFLQVKFDWIITAEQVKSYKPVMNNFNQAIKRIGVPKKKILHIAQSIFHDISPAKKAGLSTVWVNRRKNKKGFGATREAYAQPDLEVGDLTKLVELIGI